MRRMSNCGLRIADWRLGIADWGFDQRLIVPSIRNPPIRNLTRVSPFGRTPVSTCLPEPWNDGEEYRGCRRPLESESKCCRGRTTGPEAPQLSAGFLPSRTRRDVRPLYIRNSILPLLANGTLWDPWHSKSIPRPEQDAEPLHLATETRRKPRIKDRRWRMAN